ncbi:phosphoribosylanthranilate isomerase [Streptomyces sp. NBC_01498]|uniref:phosphoribosylanthranilate isomerase n=1 Tax=Streptomyces sp. NBC_01498 TaxID=2975870 RepID=UPI002E7B73CE|nr:phosphoribosylanthranilate isomerase [Streptomyces sp. NBC_01498]
MHHLYVKVCGLRNPGEVEAAVAGGASAVGFVLTASPRQLSAAGARPLAALVPPGVARVAVFRGEPLEEVRRAAAEAGVDTVQLHGGEPPEAYAALRADGYRLIRATSPRSGAPLTAGAYGEDALIIDSPRPGSGERWSPESLPERPTGSWVLSGGLSPDNVVDAVAALRPWGVDVSSGVERARGVKDVGLIREFLAAARGMSS